MIGRGKSVERGLLWPIVTSLVLVVAPVVTRAHCQVADGLGEAFNVSELAAGKEPGITCGYAEGGAWRT